jgi:hypothetical protein
LHSPIPKEKSCIVYKLNKNVLFQFKINLENLAQKIEYTVPEAICVFSPLNLAEIHVYFDIESIDSENDQETEEDKMYHYLTESSIHTIEPIFICGIKGIEEMFYLQDKNGKWIVETKGE